MDPESLSKEGKVLLQCIEFDDTERILHEIRKHPVGLFFIYAGGIFVALVMLLVGLGASLLMSSEGDPGVGVGVDYSALQPVIVSIGFVLSLASLVVMAINVYLYTSNVVLITNQKLAQFLHISLFHRKISQLSIGDIQDVTVTKQGILPSIFNYGTLVIETAGEQNNYTFTYTPEPYETAKMIVGAHEQDVHKHGN